MNISRTIRVCERSSMKLACQTRLALLVMVAAMSVSVSAQTTNGPATTNAAVSASAKLPAEPVLARAATAPTRMDESAFRIIGERNIFNANRSGGRVQLAATRRAPRIETFTLVGTMAYERGAFAFFEGSSSEFTKVLKAEGIIAGHKIVDVLVDAVKLEADGKVVELHIGYQMRREDAGAWLVSEASSGGSDAGRSSSYASTRSDDSSSRSSRSSRGGDSSRSSRNESSGSRTQTPTAPTAPAAPAPTAAEQSEILKRMMERREKE